MPPLRYYVCRWSITRPYLATSKNMKLGPSDCVLIIGLEPEHYDIIPY